jgi:hypothetical protein
MHCDAVLLRDSWFDEKTWIDWLDVSAPSSETEDGWNQLDSDVVSVAHGLIEELAHRVDRSRVRALATDVVGSYRNAGAANSDYCLRLWIATRLWGGGASDGRVPRNTRRSLLDPQLSAKLQSSVESFLTNKDLCVPKIDGVGLSYSSKWLWALGIAPGGRDCEWPKAYILDHRVRTTLGWLAAYERDSAAKERSATPGWPGSYQAYCKLLADAAEIIRSETGSHIDGEKIEWLLFSNSDGERRSFQSQLPL